MSFEISIIELKKKIKNSHFKKNTSHFKEKTLKKETAQRISKIFS